MFIPYEAISTLVYLTGVDVVSGLIGIVFLILMVNAILSERD